MATNDLTAETYPVCIQDGPSLGRAATAQQARQIAREAGYPIDRKSPGVEFESESDEGEPAFWRVYSRAAYVWLDK